jgi:hypothetical protein
VYERREESTRRESHSENPYLLSGVIGNTFTRNLWLIRVLNRVGEILNILGVLKKKEKIRTGQKVNRTESLNSSFLCCKLCSFCMLQFLDGGTPL